MLMLDKEDDNSIDKYKFYHLTDDDHLQMKKYNIHLKLTHVFIHKDLTFTDVIKLEIPGPKPILILTKFPQVQNPDKFSDYNEYTISRFYYDKYYENNRAICANIINLNTRLKLHTKISYFHELIFHLREICQNEVPEDVIKYTFRFI